MLGGVARADHRAPSHRGSERGDSGPHLRRTDVRLRHGGARVVLGNRALRAAQLRRGRVFPVGRQAHSRAGPEPGRGDDGAPRHPEPLSARRGRGRALLGPGAGRAARDREPRRLRGRATGDARRPPARWGSGSRVRERRRGRAALLGASRSRRARGGAGAERFRRGRGARRACRCARLARRRDLRTHLRRLALLGASSFRLRLSHALGAAGAGCHSHLRARGARVHSGGFLRSLRERRG